MKNLCLAALCIVQTAWAAWHEGSETLAPALVDGEGSRAPDTLFTCTSFVTLPGKVEELTKALESVQTNVSDPRITKYMIINEYDEHGAADAEKKLKLLRRKFPKFDFVQKTADHKGQAASLNMVIDILKEGNYTYWMKWEESWQARTPVSQRAFEIMDTSGIGRLAFTPHFANQRLPVFTHVDKGDYLVLSRDDVSEYKFDDKLHGHIDHQRWPLFSLQPSIERTSSILGAQFRFREDPHAWPVRFELEYAAKWIYNNRGKAAMSGVFKEAPAIRLAGHESVRPGNDKFSSHLD